MNNLTSLRQKKKVPKTNDSCSYSDGIKGWKTSNIVAANTESIPVVSLHVTKEFNQLIKENLKRDMET